ncbi:unnamed protein product, partial [Adineta steineri]
SISIDNSTVGNLLSRSNRAISVDPNLTTRNNDMKMNNGHYRHYLHQQNSAPNGSLTPYDSSITINRQFTSSDTIDQSKLSSQNISYDRIDNLHHKHYEESRLAKLKYLDSSQTNSGGLITGLRMQPKISPLHQQSSIENTVRRNLLNVKEDNIQLEQMKKTIEERLKVTLPDDIGYALSDGVVLCHFINQIRPRSVQSIHVPSQAVPKLSSAKCRRNVENFIEASRRIGVPESCLAKLTDIIASIDRTNSNSNQQLGLYRLFLTINYLELIFLNNQELCTNNLCSSFDKIIANFLLVFLAFSSFLFAYYHNYF